MFYNPTLSLHNSNENKVHTKGEMKVRYGGHTMPAGNLSSFYPSPKML